MERWTRSRKKIEKKKKDDGKSIEEPGRGTVPWISEFPTKSIGYGVVNGRVKEGGGRAEGYACPRDSWRNVRYSFL